MNKARTLLAAILLLASGPHAAAQQQSSQGPLTPPRRDIKRIPAEAAPEPPPIPVEEILRQFLKKEGELKSAFESHAYRLSVRVQEFEEDGSAGGEWQVVSDIVFKPEGSRVGRVVRQPESTLKRASFSVEDVQEFASLPHFILTPDQAARYEITYRGRQPLDELQAYIFHVRPKRLERRVGQFEGLVWVEERDLAIVKTYGRMVTELGDDAVELPFKLYETYREHIAGKYWFPTYTRSEDVLKSQSGESRLRLTIRASDFKPRE